MSHRTNTSTTKNTNPIRIKPRNCVPHVVVVDVDVDVDVGAGAGVVVEIRAGSSSDAAFAAVGVVDVGAIWRSDVGRSEDRRETTNSPPSRQDPGI